MIIEDCNKLKIKEFQDLSEISEPFENSLLIKRPNNWFEIKDFNWIKKSPSPNYELIK